MFQLQNPVVSAARYKTALTLPAKTLAFPRFNTDVCAP